jgi:hypothetical protein
MSSKKLYYLMLGAICLMIIGMIGGAYGVDKLLSFESQKLVDNRLKVAVLDQQQLDLTKAKKDVQKYQNLATIAKSVVPQDKNQAQTIGQIVALASSNGVTLSSITFPASTLGIKSGGSVSGPGLSQLSTVKDVAGVYGFQLTVQSDTTKPVAYTKFINFLSSLEHNRRTALVQSITISPNEKDRSTLSFTLILEEYIKP